MILALNISVNSTAIKSIGDRYEFDNRYWQLLDLKWEMTNDTWEEEL